jgi:lactoylglutathione lyase
LKRTAGARPVKLFHMASHPPRAPNVKQAVPFFGVASMEASLAYYVEGLGFQRTNQWVVDGKIRWCWLEQGGAALMLQEFWSDGVHRGRPEGKLGQGVSIYFMCADAIALYKEIRSRGIEARIPFVGNGFWVTELTDPDGYRIAFESPTDAPEETVYSE